MARWSKATSKASKALLREIKQKKGLNVPKDLRLCYQQVVKPILSGICWNFLDNKEASGSIGVRENFKIPNLKIEFDVALGRWCQKEGLQPIAVVKTGVFSEDEIADTVKDARDSEAEMLVITDGKTWKFFYLKCSQYQILKFYELNLSNFKDGYEDEDICKELCELLLEDHLVKRKVREAVKKFLADLQKQIAAVKEVFESRKVESDTPWESLVEYEKVTKSLRSRFGIIDDDLIDTLTMMKGPKPSKRKPSKRKPSKRKPSAVTLWEETRQPLSFWADVLQAVAEIIAVKLGDRFYQVIEDKWESHKRQAGLTVTIEKRISINKDDLRGDSRRIGDTKYWIFTSLNAPNTMKLARLLVIAAGGNETDLQVFDIDDNELLPFKSKPSKEAGTGIPSPTAEPLNPGVEATPAGENRDQPPKERDKEKRTRRASLRPNLVKLRKSEKEVSTWAGVLQAVAEIIAAELGDRFYQVIEDKWESHKRQAGLTVTIEKRISINKSDLKRDSRRIGDTKYWIFTSLNAPNTMKLARLLVIAAGGNETDLQVFDIDDNELLPFKSKPSKEAGTGIPSPTAEPLNPGVEATPAGENRDQPPKERDKEKRTRRASLRPNLVKLRKSEKEVSTWAGVLQAVAEIIAAELGDRFYQVIEDKWESHKRQAGLTVTIEKRISINKSDLKRDSRRIGDTKYWIFTSLNAPNTMKLARLLVIAAGGNETDLQVFDIDDNELFYDAISK